MRRSVLLAAVAVACSSPKPPPSEPWRLLFDDLPAPLMSAWQSSDGVLYAVGGGAGRSLVLRHDANGWWEMDPGTSQALWWTFGFSSTHVYAVGERGAISYFNGRNWVVLREGDGFTLWGIWGQSPRDLWAVGGYPSLSSARPMVLRTIDGVFLPFNTGLDGSGSLFKVWGTSSNNVIAVGDDGLVARFDGTRWARQAAPADDRLVTVFGTAADDVYAVGGLRGAVAIRFDGAEWTERVPQGTLARNLYGGARSPDGPVVYVGWSGYIAEDDGAQVREIESPTQACLHAALAVKDGFVAVGGDLLGEQRTGVLVARGDLESGQRTPWPFPGRPLDRPDAGPVDSGADGGVPDASGIAPGEYCDQFPSGCSAPNECWLLIGPNRAICTRVCTTPTDCGEFGPGACCQLPGPQVTTPVCVPAGKGGCPGPDGG